MADIPSSIPAGPDNWTSISVGPDGKMRYGRDNPAWTEEELRKALEHQRYLQDLMQRQGGWTLNSKLVGRGMPDDHRNGMGGAMYDFFRLLTQSGLGQPYGFMAPPLQSEVKSASDAVEQKRREHLRVQGLLGK